MASVKLAMKYMKRVSAELEAKLLINLFICCMFSSQEDLMQRQTCIYSRFSVSLIATRALTRVLHANTNYFGRQEKLRHRRFFLNRLVPLSSPFLISAGKKSKLSFDEDIHHEQTELRIRSRKSKETGTKPGFISFNRFYEKISFQCAQNRLKHHIKIANAKRYSANRKLKSPTRRSNKKQIFIYYLLFF
ncbi:hypothetical protein YC2023_039777 [Brassica napus]